MLQIYYFYVCIMVNNFFCSDIMIKDNNIYTSQIVNKDYKGWRIDKFLTLSFPEMSRSQLQRLIKDGNVSCDDNIIADNSFKVREDDVYQVFVPPAAEAEPKPENIPIDIVFEDDDIVVVNKPAGMTVHPAPGAYNGTLVNALLYHCGDSLSGVGGVKRPGIVHRIDKDTSGLLVVAKNDAAHRFLSEQFFTHSIERTYFALVYGLPQPLNGKIEGNIGRSPYDRKKMAILSKGGKHAVTHYQTVEAFKNVAALVKCNLETGRTHQIRVHMSSIGCNLIGDKVYEKSKKSLIKGIAEEDKNYINSFPRQALHATTLGFVHPTTHQFVQFSSSFPDDFQSLLNRLKTI